MPLEAREGRGIIYQSLPIAGRVIPADMEVVTAGTERDSGQCGFDSHHLCLYFHYSKFLFYFLSLTVCEDSRGFMLDGQFRWLEHCLVAPRRRGGFNSCTVRYII